MVFLQSSYTAIPSESTPRGKFSVSNCDQIKFTNHVPLLYVYRHKINTKGCKNSVPSVHFYVETLRSSLSQALVHYYPLAGRLCSIGGGQVELDCNAKGAVLVDAICDVDINEFGDFEPSHLVEQLLPKIDYSSPLEEIPLLLVQLTRFPCGSYSVGVAICRTVSDGSAATRFVHTWAALNRGDSVDTRMLPFLDRTVLDSYKLDKNSRFDHVEFHPSPTWHTTALFHRKPDQTRNTSGVAMLKLNKDQVLKLKSKVNVNDNNSSVFASTTRPYSAFEVVSGHMWRCLCKSLYMGNDYQRSRFSSLVNCRNRLNPPLPSTYLGNATFPTAAISSFGEIVQNPLSYAVRKIREAIERMTDEYVRSALDFIANHKDVNSLRDSSATTPNDGTEGQSSRNPNLNVVSWMNFPVHDTDFGWGNPVYMGPGDINSEGKSFILQSGDGDGSLIVVIRLDNSNIDTFRKFFYQDINAVLPAAKL